MRAACISNDPRALADHQRHRAMEFASVYALTIGKRYPILGMSITENVLEYLVRDDWGGPCFAPAGFFDLMTAQIPENWHFALKPGVHASGRELWSHPVVALWGYPELIEDPEHAAALEEQEAAAVEIFSRYADAAEEDT